MMKLKIRILTAVLGIAAGIVVTEATGAEPVKSEVIAVIEFDKVPLPEVIRKLARQAGMNVVIDPRVTEPPLSQRLVSLRWEGVTAREALLAVLENHGLVLKFPTA